MTEVQTEPVSATGRRLSELIEGFWSTQLIGTAVALGIPDHLGEGGKTCEELARDCDSDAPSLFRILRALQSLGVCRSDGTRYVLTERGRLLRRNVPGSMSGRATFTSGIMWDLYSQLTKVVKTGRSLPAGREGFDKLADHPGLNSMHQAMIESSIRAIEEAVRVHDFGRYSRVLDVGGGYGGALTALLQRFPQMTGDVLDLKYLADHSTSYLRRKGVADRARFVGGDFFESVPQGYDCYLLKYVIHDWGDAEALQILRSCSAAVGPKSHVLLIERVLPEVLEDKPEHQAIAQIDLAMMATGGKERTAEEYRSLLASAGLRMTAVLATASPCNVIQAVRAS